MGGGCTLGWTINDMRKSDGLHSKHRKRKDDLHSKYTCPNHRIQPANVDRVIDCAKKVSTAGSSDFGRTLLESRIWIVGTKSSV